MIRLIEKYFMLAVIRKRIDRWRESYEDTNRAYANAGCFEGPYYYSRNLHNWVDAEKRCADRLTKLYNKIK